MKTKRERGRPRVPAAERLAAKVDVRMRDEERKIPESAARLLGEKPSEILRRAGISRARRAIRKAAEGSS